MHSMYALNLFFYIEGESIIRESVLLQIISIHTPGQQISRAKLHKVAPLKEYLKRLPWNRDTNGCKIIHCAYGIATDQAYKTTTLLVQRLNWFNFFPGTERLVIKLGTENTHLRLEC